METFEGTGIYSVHTERDFVCIKSLYIKGDICYDYQAVEYDDGDSISDGCVIYRADHPNPERITWHPSIHMPKAAPRIWLKVKDI